jgi:nucleotide-binding universal stress UspA family protein
MLPIKTILHPTDFSECSDYAFQVAAALARDYGARLIVMHAVQPPIVVYSNGIVTAPPRTQPEQLQQKLEQRQVQHREVRVERVMVEGDPAEEVLKMATETHADVIVMGTHGWTAWSRLLMGSVAERVVRKATCPVLTIKTPVGAANASRPAAFCRVETPVAVA